MIRLPQIPARLRRSLLWGLGSAIVLASGSILLARQLWFGELVASFEWQVGWAIAAAALALSLLRAPVPAALAFALAALHLAPDLRLLASPTAHPVRTPVATLSIATANLLQPNRRHAEVAAALAGTNADVICVVELSLAMRVVLERELAAWPQRAFSPPGEDWSEQTWALGVFSKRPLADLRFVQLVECYAPLIEARIATDSGPLLLRLVHLPRPGPSWRVQARNEALAQLGRDFEWGEHALLAGDLNTTSGSPSFNDLLRGAGLSDSRQGFGRQPSWWLRTPSLRRFGAPGWALRDLGLRLGIAIDHLLIGPGLAVRSRRTFELPHSDHAGVLAELAILGPAADGPRNSAR